jgi:hypothetical protein
MQFVPPLLGLHPSAPQLIQGRLPPGIVPPTGKQSCSSRWIVCLCICRCWLHDRHISSLPGMLSETTEFHCQCPNPSLGNTLLKSWVTGKVLDVCCVPAFQHRLLRSALEHDRDSTHAGNCRYARPIYAANATTTPSFSTPSTTTSPWTPTRRLFPCYQDSWRCLQVSSLFCGFFPCSTSCCDR